MWQSDLSRRAVLTAGGGGAVAALLGVPLAGPAAAAPAAAEPAVTTDPAVALRRLLTGNRRFARGRARHPRQGPADLRRVAGGQQPNAVILGCADSRVPPELLFDQGLGDLFDNRVAGNLVDELIADSVAYAVREFRCPLVLVLGHERCGAVTATVEAIRAGGPTGPLVEALWPIVEPVLGDPGDPVENGVRANVRAQARRLRRTVAGPTTRPLVVGARYDLDTGRVTLVDDGK